MAGLRLKKQFLDTDHRAKKQIASVLTATFVVYLLFVIYGSLVPFDFRPVAWPEAVERFSRLPWLHLGIESRADAVANFLLFIPLAFFFQGLLTYQSARLFDKIFASFCVTCFSFFLALAIEFTQIQFPPRTVSLNDVVAESTGALFGVTFWLLFGSRLVVWFYETITLRGPKSTTERLFYGYITLYALFQILPLDLTISPWELYNKWKIGNIVFLPFSKMPATIWEGLYELATDIVLFVPIGVLAAKNNWITGSPVMRLKQALVKGILIAGTVELLQLFVYSRVTDTTDLITASVGTVMGAFLVQSRSSGQPTKPAFSYKHSKNWIWLILYFVLLLFIFWFPFDFGITKNALIQRIDHLETIPFYSYYFSTEFRATTAFLRQFLFYLPVGVLLQWNLEKLPDPFRMPVVMIILAVIILVIEMGQLFLPGRLADNTDMLISWLGGFAGFYLATLLKEKKLSGHEQNFAHR